MNSTEDEKIIEAYWNRKEDAIAWTEQRYGGYCGSIAGHILQNKEDTEECLNDTWMRAWNTIPPQRPESLKTYLGCLARNIAISRYRRDGAEKRSGDRMKVALDELTDVVPSSDNVAEAVSGEAVTEAINRFLSETDPQKRIMFVQRYFYLDSVSEIAEQNGVSVSNVKITLYRLRKKLKAQLKKEELM